MGVVGEREHKSHLCTCCVTLLWSSPPLPSCSSPAAAAAARLLKGDPHQGARTQPKGPALTHPVAIPAGRTAATSRAKARRPLFRLAALGWLRPMLPPPPGVSCVSLD